MQRNNFFFLLLWLVNLANKESIRNSPVALLGCLTTLSRAKQRSEMVAHKCSVRPSTLYSGQKGSSQKKKRKKTQMKQTELNPRLILPSFQKCPRFFFLQSQMLINSPLFSSSTLCLLWTVGPARRGQRLALWIRVVCQNHSRDHDSCGWLPDCKPQGWYFQPAFARGRR